VALGKNTRPYPKNYQSQEDWQHGLSGRVAAQQVQVPEFKPSYYQKKKIVP
jgi:hypothetical protein